MTSRGRALAGTWESIPAELRERRQWVGWRLVHVPGRKKPTKQPLNPTDGSLASTTDPSTWGTFDQALACPGADGIGFVFTASDPYVGIDLDDCRDANSGQLRPEAKATVERIVSYTEISPSGTGLHIIVRATLPPTGRRKGDIEIYADGRYFTMTGHRLPGTPAEIAGRDPEVEAFHEEVFGTPPPLSRPEPLHTHLTDDELVRRATAASNGVRFQALWSGDATNYGSASEADLALTGLLAFWTGPDQTRIDRLFRQSGLMRLKWDERRGDRTYGERTISTALAGRTEYYGSRPSASTAASTVDPGGFPETDAGNAEAFAALHAGDVLFDHRLQRWLIRGPHRWVPDRVDEIRLRAKAVARARLTAATAITDDDRRKRAIKHAMASESRRALEAMAELAKAEPSIADPGDSWDREPRLVGVENGVLDLGTGQLRPGRPDDRISLAIPIPYRPEAVCPRWEQFLDEVFLSDSELIAFLQRAIGYSLTGDVSEHALFLLFGTGRNGKSVLLNTLRRLSGEYSLNLPFSAFELAGRSQLTPDLAMLPGKRLVTSSETNDGARLNEARIKAMTGADPITANPKYAKPFEFTPVAKFWLAVNHLPVVHDDSEGFWRRVKLIRFERIFSEEERDPHLELRLAEELPGILAWAVRGALDWRKRGLQAPRSVLIATESYRADSDPLSEFIAACCVVSDQTTVRASELFTEYTRWCDSLGMSSRERLMSATFGRRMGDRFTKKSTNRGRMYVGIGLLAQRDGGGFAESGGLEPDLQELSHEHAHEEKFWENPPQPSTLPEPSTHPTCDDGCGTPVCAPGELCDACLGAADGGLG
ncbi:MAG: phage/plasmid primase, P4 family [Dehalococcoidia bacterium]